MASLFVQFTSNDEEYMAHKSKEKLSVLSDAMERVVRFPKEIFLQSQNWGDFIHWTVFQLFAGSGAQMLMNPLYNDTMSVKFEEMASGMKMIFAFAYCISQLAIPLPTDTILLRGISIIGKPNIMDRLEHALVNGELFKSRNFFSCSYRDEFVRKRYGGENHYIMVVSFPAGLPAVNFSIFSQYGKIESEIIFPYGLRLRILRIDHSKREVHAAAQASDPNIPSHFYGEYESTTLYKSFIQDLWNYSPFEKGMDFGLPALPADGPKYYEPYWAKDNVERDDYMRRYRSVCGSDCH